MEFTTQELQTLVGIMSHSRTSCGTVGEGNAYFNEFGAPRCEKCAVQYRIKHGEWPHGAKATVTVGIQLQKDT